MVCPMMMENSVRSKLAKEVADFYEKEGRMFSSKRTFAWNVMELLKNRLKPGDLVIDVGAGNGRLVDLLPDNVRYLGIEPSQSLRDEAEKRKAPDRNMVAGSLPNLDLQDNSADIMACIAVLHHVPSQAWRSQSIKELHRILKPGGTLLCTVWNLRSKRFWSKNAFVHAWLRLKGVKGGDPGDLFYVWKASGRPEKRFVHAFTLNEFKTLFDPALWSIEKIGAYDREGWCHWIKGRNLVALIRKKSK